MLEQQANMRDKFSKVWQKHLEGAVLDPLEAQIKDVIELYPQYHDFLAKGGSNEQFSLAENPYMRLGLHLGVRDQITTNRPEGIRDMVVQAEEKHARLWVETEIMVVLADMLRIAAESGNFPPEQEYLARIKKALGI